MANTDAKYYSYSIAEFEQYFKKEKTLADEASVSIWQIHGPWRHPPMDEASSDRAERLPDGILEDAYRIYAGVAKAIAYGKL